MSIKWLIAWLSTLVAALAAFLIGKTSKTIGIILIMLTGLYCVQYFKDDYVKLKREEAVRLEAKEIRDLQYRKEKDAALLKYQTDMELEIAKNIKEQEQKKLAAQEHLDKIAKENERKRLAIQEQEQENLALIAKAEEKKKQDIQERHDREVAFQRTVAEHEQRRLEKINPARCWRKIILFDYMGYEGKVSLVAVVSLRDGNISEVSYHSVIAFPKIDENSLDRIKHFVEVKLSTWKCEGYGTFTVPIEYVYG
jgi:hypothetical protein